MSALGRVPQCARYCRCPAVMTLFAQGRRGGRMRLVCDLAQCEVVVEGGSAMLLQTVEMVLGRAGQRGAADCWVFKGDHESMSSLMRMTVTALEVCAPQELEMQ